MPPSSVLWLLWLEYSGGRQKRRNRWSSCCKSAWWTALRMESKWCWPYAYRRRLEAAIERKIVDAWTSMSISYVLYRFSSAACTPLVVFLARWLLFQCTHWWSTLVISCTRPCYVERDIIVKIIVVRGLISEIFGEDELIWTYQID